MELFDAMLVLDGHGRILSIQWEDSSLRRDCAGAWEDAVGREAGALFSPAPDADSGTLRWRNETLCYARLQTDFDRCYLLVRRDTGYEYLFRQALDHLADGVQIYDQNACAAFMNKSSRLLSDIPDHVVTQGRHLLDLYDLDETVSTVLTCLRTRAPVINRVDSFRSWDGASITTANTAYPIFREGELAGAVVFEQNLDSTKAQIERMERIKKIIAERDSGAPYVRFSGYSFDDVVGSGEKLTEAVRLAKKVAPQNCNVLLVGETGTGKEIFAQSIHRASGRRSGKFVAINCAAVPETLIEGLLFGTKKGTFTGSTDRPGFFEEANGGTLFLDELNSMSLSMQSKLLRVVQEGVFRRVGGERDITADVRIISSCNEDPFALTRENTLRKDLFYRLSTVVVELPPLRDHSGDVNALARYYIMRKASQYGKSIDGVSPGARSVLEHYAWPGNVRELFHVLDHALNVADGGLIEPQHLPRHILREEASRTSVEQKLPDETDDFRGGLQAALDQVEERILRAVLDRCGGNISKAAQELQLRRQSLQYRIRKYGIVV